MIIFYIKEALKSISRAKSSFFLSFLSSALAVLLVNFTLYTLEFSNNFQRQLKDKVTINLILEDSLPAQGLRSVKEHIIKRNFAKSVKYLDKEEAARKFIDETGEDFRKILDYNPLPASFLLGVKDEYMVQDSLDMIIADLKKIEGVDEVVFQKDLTFNLLSIINKVKIYIYSISLILLLVSFYLVYSSVRHITNLRMNEIDTMKLVGAKLSTIKIPINLSGIITGLMAGITASLVFMSFLFYLDSFIYQTPNFRFYILISLFIAPVLAFFAGLLALRKITLKV
jgi:cell division transport system permease protein